MKMGRPRPPAGLGVSLLTPRAAMGRISKGIFVLLGSCRVSLPAPVDLAPSPQPAVGCQAANRLLWRACWSLGGDRSAALSPLSTSICRAFLGEMCLMTFVFVQIRRRTLGLRG